MKHADDMRDPILDWLAHDLHAHSTARLQPWERALPEERDEYRRQARLFELGALSVVARFGIDVDRQ